MVCIQYPRATFHHQAFDDVIRGRAIGDVAVMTADGGEWDSNLLFEVPLEHEEMQRLAGRYQKCVH